MMKKKDLIFVEIVFMNEFNNHYPSWLQFTGVPHRGYYDEFAQVVSVNHSANSSFSFEARHGQRVKRPLLITSHNNSRLLDPSVHRAHSPDVIY